MAASSAAAWACNANACRDYRERNRGALRRRAAARRALARWFTNGVLASNPCAACGLDDIRCLEFHHLRDKEHKISRLVSMGAPLSVLVRELKKCCVLCGNCHRRVEAEKRGDWRVRAMDAARRPGLS